MSMNIFLPPSPSYYLSMKKYVCVRVSNDPNELSYHIVCTHTAHIEWNVKCEIVVEKFTEAIEK